MTSSLRLKSRKWLMGDEYQRYDSGPEPGPRVRYNADYTLGREHADLGIEVGHVIPQIGRAHHASAPTGSARTRRTPLARTAPIAPTRNPLHLPDKADQAPTAERSAPAVACHSTSTRPTTASVTRSSAGSTASR